jgi:hypothetical protein
MGHPLSVLVLATLVLAGCASGGLSVSLPTPGNVTVTSPASDLAPELAAFSGTWEGAWNGNLPSRLIVERIDATSARVVYIWGAGEGGAFPAGWYRFKASVFPGGKIQFQWGTIRFFFTMSKDQTSIAGIRESPGGIDSVSMKKVAIEAAGATPHRTASGSAPPALLDHPIIPSATDLPSALGGYLGTWEGNWAGSGVRARLLVWQIDRNIAWVAYGWGDAPNGSFKAGRIARVAIVYDAEREITWGAQPRFTFHLAPDGFSLEGEWEKDGLVDVIVLTKVGPEGVR